MIAAASTAEKLQACQESGADLLLNYRQSDSSSGNAGSPTSRKGHRGGGGGDWRRSLQKLTGGRAVDVVLDNVGGADCEVRPRPHPSQHSASISRLCLPSVRPSAPPCSNRLAYRCALGPFFSRLLCLVTSVALTASTPADGVAKPRRRRPLPGGWVRVRDHPGSAAEPDSPEGGERDGRLLGGLEGARARREVRRPTQVLVEGKLRSAICRSKLKYMTFQHRGREPVPPMQQQHRTTKARERNSADIEL